MHITDLLSEAMPVIEKFAPTVAGILTGNPVGFAAGYVIPLLCEAFGMEKTPSLLPDLVKKIQESRGNELQEIESSYGFWLKSIHRVANDIESSEIHIRLQFRKTDA